MFIAYKQGQTTVFRPQRHIRDRIVIFMKGYFLLEGKLYLEADGIPVIKSDYMNGRFHARVKQYNGCWQIAIIDRANEEIILANDRWGSYPLFRVITADGVWISDQWKELLPMSGKTMDRQSVYEMAAFGYVMGNKTLIRNMEDLAPHTVETYSFRNAAVRVSSDSYWHLRYRFRDADEKTKEKEFAERWQHQLKIYANAVRDMGNACYIPMSGGLDSRLLASEMDRHDVSVYAMTYGGNKSYKEIDAALNVVGALKHAAGHYIQYLNQETITRLNHSPHHCNLITSSYFSQLYLDYFYRIKDRCKVIMPGLSGDFMGGSLIRNRMLKWTNRAEALDYIILHRSAPMVKAFYEDPVYKDHIRAAFDEHFPKDDEVISGYVRWFAEHDIRRYLIRSVLNDNHPHGHLLLPFFDYELIDFFLDLPIELLINKRLYTNTQIKYLYRHNPSLLRIPRAKPNARIRPVKSTFFDEYGPKLREAFRRKWLSSRHQSLWDKRIDWPAVFGETDLPEWMDKTLTGHPALRSRQEYLLYFNTISKIYRELAE